MNEELKTSQEGISLIKLFEGCELSAYRCSADVPTIGYGHTAGVSDGDTCTQEEAESMLSNNLGPTNLKSSTLLRELNESKYDEVPRQIKRWNKAAGQVLDGLVRRREAESLLWKGEAWEKV